MPIQLDSVEQFQSYLSGVVDRARHHAPEIQEVILTLAGAVLLSKDAGTAVEARSWQGSTANILWATFNGQRHVFTYDHRQSRIVIKQRSTRGPVVGYFDNRTSTAQVINIFRRL